MRTAARDAIFRAARRLAADLTAETLAVCRIPAPTFAEARRAQYVVDRLVQMGVADVEQDELANVWGWIRGCGDGPCLMLAAHTDTVFSADTPIEPRFDGRYWWAPGIRDNSASVAVTLFLAELWRRGALQPTGDVILAFPVGEEGLGDLQGMKALIRRLGDRIDGVIAVDGNLGSICHAGIWVRRLEVSATTPGGHSWGNFGNTSALHVLAHMVSRIARLPAPADPKVTYNVGVFTGGTSVNTIAQHARFELDLRSTNPDALSEFEQRVRELMIAEAQVPHLDLTVRVVGDRPGGCLHPQHPLVRAALKACKAVSAEGRLFTGSTDANIPLSMGMPAISMGVSVGGGIHTLQEYLEPDSLVPGLQMLATAVLEAQCSWSHNWSPARGAD